MKTLINSIRSNLIHIKHMIMAPYYSSHPMQRADYLFKKRFGRSINWQDPENLNEKINWLKFHVDPYEWACLADKYKVRKYVERRGLGNLLIPLFGEWQTVDAFLEDWESLPDEFVIKSNNGCGHNIIINRKNGGKKAIDKAALKKELKNWLKEKKYGLHNVELHYQLIDNRIMAEEFLSDPIDGRESNSLIDYKIWCFDGNPYGCLLVYNRGENGIYSLDYYDINWEHHPEYLCGDHKQPMKIPKPINWEDMVNAARILSKGHPQVRVDFYNINGNVYFGELTFTSLAGFMTYFTEDALKDMGSKVTIDKTLPLNFFV